MAQLVGGVKPKVTEEEAAQLVDKLYGLKAVKIKQLPSYDDLNFYMEFDELSNNSYISEVPKEGVFRYLNSLASQYPYYQIIDCQTEVAFFLKEKNFNVPCAIKNKNGEFTSMEKISGNSRGNTLVRLLSYLPGNVLRDFHQTSEILFEAGKLMAQMDNALQDFTHPGIEYQLSVIPLSGFEKWKAFILSLDDEQMQSVCHQIIRRFEEKVIFNDRHLTKGIIHGDFHSNNIIVNDEGYPYGIIDFGDVQYSYYVIEVAISVAHFIYESKHMDGTEAGGHALAGFLAARSLNQAEFSVLKECIETRLVQMLVFVAQMQKKDSTQVYAINYGEGVWKALSKLLSFSHEKLYKIWADIITSHNVKFPYSVSNS